VRVSSHLAAPRRTPQQQRGERRVATLLASAAAVIEEDGYESATMSEIAKRAGASIGSLYQFFPNKESLAEALRHTYCHKLERLWEPLKKEAPQLSLQELVDRLINGMTGFFEEHPAFLKLLDAPLSVGRNSARARFREQLTELFHALDPKMPRGKAKRLAVVAQQLMRSLRAVYAEAKPIERPSYIKDFKQLLLFYLTEQIGPHQPATKRVSR
jgi:AcrR family transcriptional regulator